MLLRPYGLQEYRRNWKWRPHSCVVCVATWGQLPGRHLEMGAIWRWKRNKNIDNWVCKGVFRNTFVEELFWPPSPSEKLVWPPPPYQGEKLVRPHSLPLAYNDQLFFQSCLPQAWCGYVWHSGLRHSLVIIRLRVRAPLFPTSCALG